MKPHVFDPSRNPERCKCGQKKQHRLHIDEGSPVTKIEETEPEKEGRKASFWPQTELLTFHRFEDKAPPPWPSLLLFAGPSDVRSARYYLVTGFFYPKHRPHNPCLDIHMNAITDTYDRPEMWAEAPAFVLPGHEGEEPGKEERNDD